LANGDDDFEKQKAIFLTNSKIQAALYALGKTLKDKTCFALPPKQLIIVGKNKPSEGYVYAIDVNAKKGIWDQYSYTKTIKNFKKTKVDESNYKKYIKYVGTKKELIKICNKEKKIWLEKEGYCIPRITFRQIHPKHYLPIILRFLNPRRGEWDWKEKILDKYPGLKKRLKDIKSVRERERIITKFFYSEYKVKRKILKQKEKNFTKNWEKISEVFFITLSNTIGLHFPKKMNKIRAYITLNPICPRNILKNSFDIYYNYQSKQVIAISMHEIFHFLYFEKCKKVFKKSKQKCDPLLGLHLSEIIPKIILNMGKFQNLMNYNHKTYPEYLRIKINGKRLDLCIKDILEKSKNFEEFLIKSDRFMFRNKEIIKKGLKD